MKKFSSSTINIIKQSVPVLADQGDVITQCFYETLFDSFPELKNLFNMANQRDGKQSKALAEALFAYANLVEDTSQLAPLINRIAHKHVSLNIKAEHYPMVGNALLSALSKTLNLPMTHEIIIAWKEAYESLAGLFISRETELYSANANQVGGWKGFRKFVVAHIETETPFIKSFYLCPMDDHGLPLFKPGQYVGVLMDIPDHPYEEIRQYSLSDRPGQSHYRISVKIELGSSKGIVSNYLHQNVSVGDTINLSAPSGDFTLPDDSERDLVLISAGVGITPMMSMLKSQLAEREASQITFVHCAENSEHHCFSDELMELKRRYNFHYFVAYANDDSGDHLGFLNQEALNQFMPKQDADYYFCGPFPFMISLNELLINSGVRESRINYEVFGPTLTLVA